MSRVSAVRSGKSALEEEEEVLELEDETKVGLTAPQ